MTRADRTRILPQPHRQRSDAGPSAKVSIRWANQGFDLLADRAAYWRKARTLIIADAHFGKAAAFRSAGVPVPEATTQSNLDRLTRALQQTGATRLMILGDFLHARSGRAPQTMDAIAAWRDQRNDLEITLVRGNHDRNAGDPPEQWRMRCVDEPFVEGGVRFVHDPATCADDASPGRALPAMGGHVHPCAILHDVDGSAMRVACFHVSPGLAVLPAFGAFTGMHPVRPRAGDRVFALGAGAVVEVRSLAAARR